MTEHEPHPNQFTHQPEGDPDYFLPKLPDQDEGDTQPFVLDSFDDEEVPEEETTNYALNNAKEIEAGETSSDTIVEQLPNEKDGETQTFVLEPFNEGNTFPEEDTQNSSSHATDQRMVEEHSRPTYLEPRFRRAGAGVGRAVPNDNDD